MDQILIKLDDLCEKSAGNTLPSLTYSQAQCVKITLDTLQVWLRLLLHSNPYCSITTKEI